MNRSFLIKLKNKVRVAFTTFKSHVASSLLLLLRLKHVRSKHKENVKAMMILKDKDIMIV